MTSEERARLERGIDQSRTLLAEEKFLAWVCYCGHWCGPADLGVAPRCKCGHQMHVERLALANELDAARLQIRSYEINHILDQDERTLERRRFAAKV